ncbi:MAG: cation diffusion facilitator family transporter [Sphingobium sp.]|uniref:Cation transporter n=3 Tax=Sphingomonadales TaxID=204457 RepID=A0A3A1P2T5_9SPHN|nr:MULTISPECIES: cation diffusion facilitator family transporter [Sphingomonadaceae]AJA10936.1 cation diffusion facilitator family transporter [Sphingopyxis fribergensis]MDX3901867.1 cation diffusion facilitator family transporter [Sphingobium sp.]RIV84506.1 cation transporter [Aurantiacibacter xanthus]TNF05090.1 MAG: cation transporter [Sphingomonadales bacterium]
MPNPRSSHDRHGYDHHHVGGHDHDHSHLPVVTEDNERKILLSFLIIFAFMFVEAVGGYLSGSLALLADAGHMLTDAIALGLAYAAFRLGRRAADGQRSFGYARFEVIAGFVNALTLFGIVAWVLYEAVERFQNPGPVLAGSMFVVALTGMLVNLFVLWFLTRGDSDHVNVKGAVLHVMGDLLGSVGAIVAAGAIWFTGWTPIDPILSVLVSLLILRSAWSLLKNTLHILLEGAPANASSSEISEHLRAAVPGLQNASHIHIWSLTSGRVLATLQVQPADGADIRHVIGQVEHELKTKFQIEHPTIGIDWDGNAGCSLDAPGQAMAAHTGHAH